MTDTLTETYGQVPHGARMIRTAVFIEEQGFTDEFDATDSHAYHLVLSRNGNPLATGRVFKENNIWHIGRLAVLKPHRQEHLGTQILSALEKIAHRQGAPYVTLSAQLQAQTFYTKQGYTPYGDTYLDENCPHIAMRKNL